MLQRLFFIAACLGLSAAATLPAATFEVTASVDRQEVELGEPLHLSLTWQENGRFDFPVQPEPFQADGFNAAQVGNNSSFNWVNGAQSVTHSVVLELTPFKAGDLLIPSLKFTAKDAQSGETVKMTPAFHIHVRRPKNAYNGLAPQPTALPTYGIQNQAQETPPAPDDSGLRDIKADRGLPWGPLALIFGAFGAVMALLVWWARRPTEEEPALPTVRDPRALAFKQLDAALQVLAKGDEKGFVLGAGQALRGYLRQRLDLRREATLAEAMRECARKLPDAPDREASRELLLRLEVLLYGDAAFKAEDKAGIDGASRQLIDTMERLAGR